MSSQKKRIIVLEGLLILLLALAVSDKDISMLEYMYVFIIAEVYLVLSFSFQTRIESLKRQIEGLREYVWGILIRSGLKGKIQEIDALPKVPAATGQIYVDYEDVMRILRGDEIVER